MLLHSNDSKISIKVDHLRKTFLAKGKDKTPIVANDDLSFEVSRGEIFGLLGPNGAGKTTLIFQLLGLLKPSSGKIWVEGVDVVSKPEEVKKLTGFLPQSGLPLRFVEVEQALYFSGRLRGQSEMAAKQQTRRLLEELGLGDYRNRQVNKLSGGLLRLCNFGMALMGEPQLLVLDEPTNELDPHNRRLIWSMINELNRQQGVTTILVTHNVLEAEQVIRKVAVMQKGRIIALGTPGELKQQVGQRIRLELRLKEGESFLPEELEKLRQLGGLEEVKPGYYRLYLSPESVPAATDFIANDYGLSRLEDFRLAPPSLEDVYLELGDPALPLPLDLSIMDD